MKTNPRRMEYFYKNKCERLEKIIEVMTEQVEDMQSQLRDYAALDGFQMTTADISSWSDDDEDVSLYDY